AGSLGRRSARQRTPEGYTPSRPPGPDHRRANLPDGSHGLRATQGAPDQPLDRTRNRRRSDGTRHHRADFTATCRPVVKKRDLKPHLIRYWLTPPEDAHKEETVRAICNVYKQAPQLAQEGEQTVSTDELTAIQALERKHPGLPLAPGKVERREFEYIGHGTRCFILSRDVVTGKLVAPYAGPTRTEADFLAHVQAVVATDPEAKRWHIVCDQLNIHQSESLVRWVAHLSALDEDLGVKGERGILASMVS